MKLFAPNATDSYKLFHIDQNPAETDFVYSNMTARSDHHTRFGSGYDHKSVLFGLQGATHSLLIDFWNETFFSQPKGKVMDRFRRRVTGNFGTGSILDKMGDLHDLGYLPLLIKALPEGSRVPMKVPFFTICNTHSDFGWVTNFVETPLSAETWKQITSATTAYEYRRVFQDWATKTGAPLEFVPWQGHDFSMRGCANIMDAATNGGAHLTSFLGTDTMPAMDYLDQYYSGAETFLGGSVYATEHSTMCLGGKAGEFDTFKRLLTEVHPTGIVSIVSDTWNLWNVIKRGGILEQLKEEILNRKPDAMGFAKAVTRPDSSPTTPTDIICGDPTAEEGSPARKGVTECLWDIFGGTTTSTGHKYLHERVGHIYGDSITPLVQEAIFHRLAAKGFAAQGVLGMGSFTYQFVTRDTLGQAVKATYGIVDGQERELFKDPITDTGMKKSAKGLLRVDRNDAGELTLYDQQTTDQETRGLLQPLFRDGKMVRHQTIADIRTALWG